MMNRITILIVLGLLAGRLSAQYDKNWLMGNQIIVKVNFYLTPYEIVKVLDSRVPVGVRSVSTITNIKEDSIFFYSNGAAICDRFGNPLLNSEYNVDSLYYGNYFDGGATSWQCSIMLPRDDSSFYSINQSESDSITMLHIPQPDRLYYSIVNMYGDHGKGEVVFLKESILEGLMGEGRLTACRHANGRDWWIIQTGFANNLYNAYHIILCTPDNIKYVKTYSLGPPIVTSDSQGQAVFSPDGTKYAQSTQGNQTVIFDFDRCTGTLSNEKVVKFPKRKIGGTTYNIPGAIGLAFSPDGKNLYGNTLFSIFQISNYEDTATPVVRLIAEWDSTYSRSAPFEQANLAPDGKIYIGSYDGGTNAFHVIDSANNTTNPSFIYQGFKIDSVINASAVSNMPNYRLGKIEGSACDTIVSGIGEVSSSVAQLKLYPNPASNHLTISLMEYAADARLTITDATGKVDKRF
jgi:hypothetical protein